MFDVEEYAARIEAWWRRPIRGRGYDYWLAVYEANARAGVVQ